MIRVELPYHLRNLARVEGEVQVRVDGPLTLGSLLDALEAAYPILRGTIRDHGTMRRRPFLRFFACREDLSLEPADAPLPEAVAAGAEPFLVVGGIAGGYGAYRLGGAIGEPPHPPFGHLLPAGEKGTVSASAQRAGPGGGLERSPSPHRGEGRGEGAPRRCKPTAKRSKWIDVKGRARRRIAGRSRPRQGPIRAVLLEEAAPATDPLSGPPNRAPTIIPTGLVASKPVRVILE